jgi:outer membrane protein assembly factor BamD
LIAVFILGCATTDEDELAKLSANELYDRAKTALNSGDYETAINTFEKLEARFPFGKYAQQAQLEIAYAYYLKGLTNYSRGASIMDRMAPREPSERDTRALRDAFNDFSQLAKKFPESRYADDTRQRLIYLHNQLAQYEIHVANYYMRRGAYVAAANRAKYVVENYQRTPAAQEALQVLIRAYSKMGMEDLANDTKRVLELNRPGQSIPAATTPPGRETPEP